MKQKIRQWKGTAAGMPLFVKFALALFLGVLVPLAAQNAVFLRQTEESINREMMKKLDESLESEAEALSGLLTSLTTMANRYRQNEVLYRYLDQEYQKDLDVMIRYQDELHSLFTGDMLFPQNVRSMRLYTTNGSLFDTAFAVTEDSLDGGTLGRALLYNNIQPVQGEKTIRLQTAVAAERDAVYGEDRSLSLLVTLDFFRQYGRYDKLLRIDVDLGAVSDAFHQDTLFHDIVLADSRGSAIASAHDAERGLFAAFSAQEEEQEGLQVLQKPVGEFPLTLYGVYDPELFAGEFRQSRVLAGLISAACLLVCCLFLFGVMRSIHRRLTVLAQQAGQIAHGHFTTVPVRDGGRNEFDQLQGSINSMSMQLRRLIEEGYQAELARVRQEKETNQARLLALQAQVNPHFLFNALESVRLRALARGERETAGVIKHMARMFRRLIEWDRSVITLEEELRFLKEFFIIQSYRFEDEFSYELDVSPEANDCLLPKMILQPLVENAFAHGMAAVEENRWVGVHAAVKDGFLELRVEDNGGGIPPEKLRELQAMLAGGQESGRSVGLRNVARRLALCYGGAYRFQIESTPGRGTVCTIHIPAKKEEPVCTPS